MHRKIKIVKRTPAAKQQPITSTISKLDGIGGTVIAALQMQDDFLDVTDELHAKLWGAAIGRPMYLRMDDHHSTN